MTRHGHKPATSERRRHRPSWALVAAVGALVAGPSTVGADEFVTVTTGPFGTAYVRDEKGLIVGSVSAGFGDRFYLRDRAARIVGTLDAATASGILNVSPE